MLLRTSTTTPARRGIILIVVLALLTLFAIVGLSFVLYAQSEAESSRIWREALPQRGAVESPDKLRGFALSKLIYDEFDDATGVYSALRGHSLARSMYGFDNYIDTTTIPGTPLFVPNQTAFNGAGRNILATVPNPFSTLAPPVPESQLVNYTFFAADGMLHDPERIFFNATGQAAWRTGADQPGPVTGGFNVPYTYPDLNNMFLGAVNAGGQVLMPSFHRPWLFGPIDPTSQPTGTNPNLNWTNGQGKYMTLRPREFDQRINPAVQSAFPYPDDAGGDVKNLWWLPGGNDSIWIDLGYPVQVAPDGRKYKPLFAFFITDLDNRINLNVHGNIRGLTNGAPPFVHLSNQGWVKTEVNLSKVLIPNVPSPNPMADPTEWSKLYTGVGSPNLFNTITIRGRYGWDLFPNDPGTYTSATGNQAPPSGPPHVYSQVDYDAGQQNFLASLPIQLPSQFFLTSGGGYTAFPIFGMIPAGTQTQSSIGYDNGGGGASPPNNAELVNHPSIYDYFRPFQDPVVTNPALPPDNRAQIDDRAFPAFEMLELLNGGLVADPNATGPYGNAPIMAANAMKSQLGALLSFNFNDPLDIAGSLRRRGLVTTLSMDLSRPGMMPWMWNADLTDPTTGNLLVADQIQMPRAGDDPVMSRNPWANPSPFPDPNGTTTNTNRAGPIPANSEFNVPGSAALFPQSNWRAAIQAVRQITGRIDLSRGLTAYPPLVLQGNYRYDVDAATNGPIFTQFLQAQTDRQKLAAEIYAALRKIAGVQTVPDPTQMTEAQLMPRRWLAQLAVNIVDFIDNDDISTPFNFHIAEFSNTPPLDTYAAQNPTSSNIFPPEIFKYWVFGTELPRIVLNEVFAEYTPAPVAVDGTPVTVKVWAELQNTMPLLAPAAGQGPWDPSDTDPTQGGSIPIYVPATAGATNGYAPYRVTVAGTAATATGQLAPGGPLTPRTSPPLPAGSLPPTTTVDNDNVLGTPDQIRTETLDDTTVPVIGATPPTPAYTTAGAFSLVTYQVANAAGNAPVLTATTQTIPPGKFLVLGPGTNATGTFDTDMNKIANYVADGALAIPTTAMQYMVTANTTKPWAIGTTGIYDVSYSPTTIPSLGVTVMLRRLANPHLPPNMDSTSPVFNPYVSTDFMEGIVPQTDIAGAAIQSSGKLQPYASANIAAIPTWAPQKPINGGANTYHTLGSINTNNGTAAPAYDWLVHLDRQLVSPVELLHVSGYHPHELTHRFISATPDPTDPLSPKFGHRVHWFDQSTRLYRLWEFLEVTDRAYGVTPLGRRPGKININTVWDREILNALLDPQTSNYFGPSTSVPQDDVTTIYNNLILSRTPGYAAATGAGGNPLAALSPLDQPFAGMASGNIPYADPFYPNGTSTFYPNAAGIGDTFLRPNTLALNNAAGDLTGQGHPELPRLFENPNSLVQTAAGPPPTYGPIPPNPTTGVQLSHPYIRFEPLNKVYNNLTTRSNVFAVWCTVGYFEVTDDSARPVKLGAEIGKASGTNVRHRFFSVIDRTQLVIARNLLNSAFGVGGAVVNPTNPLLGPGVAWAELELAPGGNAIAIYNPATNTVTGQTPSSMPGRPPTLWSIGVGSVLALDRGQLNEEWVQVTAISSTNPNPGGVPAQSAITPVWIQASFIRPHNPGFTITQPGNPGPQLPLDMRDYQHAPVVPVSVTLN